MQLNIRGGDGLKEFNSNSFREEGINLSTCWLITWMPQAMAPVTRFCR
ncbi:MAG: hypothetical protein R2727_10695 [Bacteroidales bacterium]